MQSKDYELIIHQTFVQTGQLWIHYSLLNQEGQGVHNQFMPLSDLTEGLNYAIYQSKFAILKGTQGQVNQTGESNQSLLDPKATTQIQTDLKSHKAVESNDPESSLQESNSLPDPSHVHDFALKDESDSQPDNAAITTDLNDNATSSAQNNEETATINKVSTIEPSTESDLLPDVTDEEAKAVEVTNEEVNQKNITNADTLFDAMAAAEDNE
ncbi:hypothetical protein [Fructobacillus tropaeoli]|uniref:hypothetical protein n=1 Tax=Fructobacillus tropaeoli TaxID=709323 RepID=UPI0019437EDE|nr:hypothetical protein [Fructobacillus tropaeoli]GIC69412.1 hypothetical protein FT12353_00480 [Fructobacillus tropaeoli]